MNWRLRGCSTQKSGKHDSDCPPAASLRPPTHDEEDFLFWVISLKMIKHLPGCSATYNLLREHLEKGVEQLTSTRSPSSYSCVMDYLDGAGCLQKLAEKWVLPKSAYVQIEVQTLSRLRHPTIRRKFHENYFGRINRIIPSPFHTNGRVAL